VSMRVLGSIPVLRDKLQLPILRSDGKPGFITPREVLRMEEQIKKANRNCLINEGTRKTEPSLLKIILGLLSGII